MHIETYKTFQEACAGAEVIWELTKYINNIKIKYYSGALGS